MSANRRHATAPELGWLDLKAAAGTKPFRAQGRVHTDGDRVKRFNRAVRILDSNRENNGEPVMTVMRVKFVRKLGLWVDTGETMRLRWETLDWISFKAAGDPNGTWMKVTVEGRSQFGPWTIDEKNNVVHLSGRMVTFDRRSEAVAWVVRHLTA